MKPQRPNALHDRVAAVHKCRRSLRRPLFISTSNFKGHLRDYSSSGRTNSLHRRELGAGSDHISQNCGVGDPGRHASGCIHHTPYTKARDLRRKKKNIYIYMRVISAAATTCRRKHSGGQGTPHAKPRFRTAGSQTGPTVLRADAIRMCYEPHGRAARRETRPRYRANTAQRTGALLPPLAPLAAPAEIKTMATLRLRDRRENDVIFRGPEAIIPQAM